MLLTISLLPVPPRKLLLRFRNQNILISMQATSDNNPILLNLIKLLILALGYFH
jgi:hypothetical protein